MHVAERLASELAPLTRMADNVMMYKYICKNVARRHDKVATFMPKPLFAGDASGMHCPPLWNGDRNLFYDSNGWALTSQECRWYIGGLLEHAPALKSSLCNCAAFAFESADAAARSWLRSVFNEGGRAFGTAMQSTTEGTFVMRWQ